MSRKSRYAQLCDAYRAGVKTCDNYRQQSREFVSELRQHLIGNFECPETRLYLFPPSQGFSTKPPILPGDSTDIEFLENGDSVIGVAINANDRKTDNQNMFFTFTIRFRLVKEKLMFSIIDDDQEFPGNEDGIMAFCDYLFEMARDNLTNRLQAFLQDDQDPFPIGFRVGEDDTR